MALNFLSICNAFLPYLNINKIWTKIVNTSNHQNQTKPSVALSNQCIYGRVLLESLKIRQCTKILSVGETGQTEHLRVGEMGMGDMRVHTAFQCMLDLIVPIYTLEQCFIMYHEIYCLCFYQIKQIRGRPRVWERSW